MAKENLIDAIGDIAREKGIPRERLLAVIQEAITAAAKRKYRHFEDIEARINTSNGELEVFRYKVVTEELTDPDNQISLDEARKLDTLAEPGDEVEYEIDNTELSRVIAQTARQMIFQKIREAERETIFENFKDRKGEILNGVVSRTERGRVYVTFNQTEAILYRRDQIPHERYAPGDHLRVILLDVLNDPKEPSLLVISRSHPDLLCKLFEMEVPEIYDGIVEIVNAAREAGRRAKIAVRSNDSDVDPVGACVGMRGSRVQAIVSELRGEKIDIIHYSEDLPTYVANALAPAELTRIKIDREAGEIDVEVEPDQLSLAIGRQGQNVRLASQLVGFRINVRSTQDSTLSLEEQIRERLMASRAELDAAQARNSDLNAALTQEIASQISSLRRPEEAEEGAAPAEGEAPAPLEGAPEAVPAAAEPAPEGTPEEAVTAVESAEPAPEGAPVETTEPAPETSPVKTAGEGMTDQTPGEEAAPAQEDARITAVEGAEAVAPAPEPSSDANNAEPGEQPAEAAEAAEEPAAKQEDASQEGDGETADRPAAE